MPVFSSGDVMKQLPTEGQRFVRTDEIWRSRMRLLQGRPGALEVRRGSFQRLWSGRVSGV